MARASQRGQAVTETLLISWIMVIFFAATYQLFLVNNTIFRSMTAVHAELFQLAFDRNCARNDDACKWDPDNGSRVDWDKQTIPEIQLWNVPIFERFGLSDTAVSRDGHGATPKVTKVGAGPYYPICIGGFSFGDCLPFSQSP